MNDETTPAPTAKKDGVVEALLGAVKLDWVRPLVYKVGGRKVALAALGLYAIREIGVMDLPDMVKIAAIAGSAIVTGAIAWSIAIEDRKAK